MSIGVGVIGYGFMGSRRAAAVEAIDGAELVAVADVLPERLEKAREKHPGVRVYRDPVELINDSGVEAVVIATYPDTHVKLLREAVARGKHVLVEKPLAVRLSDIDPLLDPGFLREARGLVVMTGFSLRYHPMYRFVWEKLRDRGVLLAHHTALGDMPGVEWLRNPGLSGGMLNENAVHIIYLYIWYMGNPLTVYASLYSTLGPGIDDNVFLAMRHSGGATSSLTRSWTGGRIIRYFDFILRGGGSIHIDGYLGGKVLISTSDGDEEKEFPFTLDEMYHEETRHFIECIKTGRKPHTRLWHGVTVQAVVEAAHISSNTNTVIKLDKTLEKYRKLEQI